MKPIKLLFGGVLFLSACASYRSLHQDALLIDTHNDVISQVVIPGQSMEGNLTGKAHTDLDRLKKGGVDGQFFAIFCDEKYGAGKAYAFANRQIDSLEAIVKRNPSKIAMAYTPDQLQTIAGQDKIAAMMGVEGGHMIEDRIDYLHALYKRGVRYMTLTWNNSTSWASSAADETSKPTMNKGLNELGRKIVGRMNELGMLVDLSHVGEKTFYDAIAVTKKPVLVSHSCSWALCQVPRNLKDDQIRAIAKNGGVIHVNFYSGFLDSTYSKRKSTILNNHKDEIAAMRKEGKAGYEIDAYLAAKYPAEMASMNADPALLIDHIDHIVKIAGIDYVGLGSDYDGIESPPRTLDDVTTYPIITRMLLKRGYSKEDVRKILGGNFMRVWRANAPQ